MQTRYVYRFLEFFFVGFVMGIAEDLIAIHYATDAVITSHVILVAALVALPFAIISEILVDWTHIKFLRKRWNQKFLKVDKKGRIDLSPIKKPPGQKPKRR